MHYSCLLIILFNAYLYKSAFSTFSLKTSFSFFCALLFVCSVLNSMWPSKPFNSIRWKSKTRVTSFELRVQIYGLRVQIHALRVQIYELQVQIYELQVQIHELRDQIYQLRVQIHKLGD